MGALVADKHDGATVLVRGAGRESPEHAMAPPQVKARGPPPMDPQLRASELLEIDQHLLDAAAATEREAHAVVVTPEAGLCV